MRSTHGIFWLLLLAATLAGCGRRLVPPATVSQPAQVFVIDYGQHASLALPDERGQQLTEWAWGDWHWFALERTGLSSGLRALFASPQSTLSRRSLAPAPNAEQLRRRVGAQQVLGLTVERSRVRALDQRLHQRWSRRAGEAVVGRGGRRFVPDDARYSIANNSVHELDRWLEELGVKVAGRGPTANYRPPDG